MSRLFGFVANKYNNIIKNKIVKSVGPIITGWLLLGYSKSSMDKYINNGNFNKHVIITNPLDNSNNKINISNTFDIDRDYICSTNKNTLNIIKPLFITNPLDNSDLDSDSNSGSESNDDIIRIKPSDDPRYNEECKKEEIILFFELIFSIILRIGIFIILWNVLCNLCYCFPIISYFILFGIILYISTFF